MTADATTPPARPLVWNEPFQETLQWRVATRASALERMRVALAAGGGEARRLADAPEGDPAHTLLDAWAVVADTVSFYTERIACEGYVGTAVERASANMMLRGTGYELKPGLAAEVPVAFEVEDAPGAPAQADIPAGTPIQSVPGPGELPQTFETKAPFTAHAGWNTLRPAKEVDQAAKPEKGAGVWVRAQAHEVAAGDWVVLVLQVRADGGEEITACARVTAVDTTSEPGWVRVTIGEVCHGPGAEGTVARLVVFRQRARVVSSLPSEVAEILGELGEHVANDLLEKLRAALAHPGHGGSQRLVLRGDWDRIPPGSWVLVEVADGNPNVREVISASPGAEVGRLPEPSTIVTAKGAEAGDPVMVHFDSREFDATWQPNLAAVTSGGGLTLPPASPSLPLGHTVVVAGWPEGQVPDPRVAATALPPLAAVAEVTGNEGSLVVSPVPAAMAPGTLRVYANVVLADHGETVEQVLGDGDGSVPFQQFTLARGPLTHVRAATATGARSTLEVRVDGVRWERVESLGAAGPDDRVFVEHQRSDGRATVTTGNGVQGARVPTGAANVTARYRVGVGSVGALDPGQLSVLPRKPYGIRGAFNPLAPRGWAAPEGTSSARRFGHSHGRALGRIVSVGDVADLARSFAGVGHTTARLLWNEGGRVVVLSVLDTVGQPPDKGLLGDLRAMIDDRRDPMLRVEVLPAKVTGFVFACLLTVDPDYQLSTVRDRAEAVLRRAYQAELLGFGTPVIAAQLARDVRKVEGVVSVRLPSLRAGSAEGVTVLRPALGEVGEGAGVFNLDGVKWGEK